VEVKPKLAIATAHSGRPVMPQWYISMMRLIPPPNSIHVYLQVIGKKMDDAYNELAEQSIAAGAEFTLFVDDDTQLPPNAIPELLNVLENSSPDVMAAGGIYTTRDYPISPLVFQGFGQGPFWKWKVGEIFPCHSIGSGAMMVRNEVFSKIEKPWFKKIDTLNELATYGDLFPLDGLHAGMVSVDIFFCQKLAQSGFKVMAHGGVLPIHWGSDGKPYYLPLDSYPMKIAKAHRIDGWMSASELMWLAKQAESHKQIVEIGSYLGRSTRALGDYTNGTVWVFDDWQGPRDIATPRNGDFLHAFENNLGDLLESGRVKMVNGDHRDTSLIPNDLVPDMVFIDGSHEFADVKGDIGNWKNRISKGGIICGHDISRPGVKNAVISEFSDAWRTIPNTDLWSVTV
jgi:predicted O-methyltransferase YrrM